MREETVQTVVEAEAQGMRLDSYISEYLELFSRSQVKKRVVAMELDGKPAKASTPLIADALLTVRYRAPEPLTVEAEPLPLSILYEDDDVVVFHKPQGMVVHPAAGNYTGTLVQGLLHHVPRLREAFPDEELRPGIVHRLDKETSGVLIAAKHPAALEELSSRFASREVEKSYLALVKGVPGRSSGVITYPISRDPHNRKRFTWKLAGGKEAETEYHLLCRYDGYSLLLLHPRTGRTHQLRVHLASQGTPVLGDPLYSRPDARFPGSTLMLHAFKLRIRLPGGGKPATFRAPLAGRFAGPLRSLSRR